MFIREQTENSMLNRLLLFFTMVTTLACETSKQQQAAGPGGLSIMTYNIHHANPPSKPNFIDIDAIAAVINREKPDVVMLQEVDVNTGRSKLNEAVVLAEKTKMNFYFAKAIDHDGGDYGVAILSRYSLSNGKTHKLPTLEGSNGEPRVLATANITVNGKQLTIACTHLDAQRSDTNRILQINAIMDILKPETNPVIIAGDLNATPGGTVINTLDKNFTRSCLQNCAFTIPQVSPTKEIDFIAFKPSMAFSVQSHQVIDEKYASDHLPVLARLVISN
jgi:endonuclease/exonuclease/phosphatase family metal-dependent hydrolase